MLIERWRQHYNTIRPHSALGYRPPAPEAWQPRAFAWRAPEQTHGAGLLEGKIWRAGGQNPNLENSVIHGGRSVSNSSASTLAILTANASGDCTFSGVIEDGIGSVGLNKSGLGSLTLAGMNLYTGPTTIAGGMLVVNGSI